ncbi:MAG: hypothetical protein GX258_04585 [Clostridiales bacterium]|nr:hypothetical protein [Clostridiales bacterium]
MLNKSFEEKLTKHHENKDKEIVECKNLEVECKGLNDKQEELDKFWDWEYSLSDM